MMVHYKSHLRSKEFLNEDTHTFIFNSITRKNCVSFVNRPDDTVLFRSTGHMTTDPPANTGLACEFKVFFSPADSFKKIY